MVSLTGCHAYHTVKFAHQDKQTPLEEPYLMTSPPSLDGLVPVMRGELSPIHGGDRQFGVVTMYQGSDVLYLRIEDWATVEGPDLYFYIGPDSLDEVMNDHDKIENGGHSLQLIKNNMRPSNLGFDGDDLWFLLPDSFRDASNVTIHCTQFSKLFAGGELVPVP